MDDSEFVADLFGVTKDRAKEMISNGLNVEFLKNNASGMMADLTSVSLKVDHLADALRKATSELNKSANDI